MSKNFSRFPYILCFSPKRAKMECWYLKNFEKYVKIIHFCNSLKRFFEKFVKNFRKFVNNFRTIVFFRPNTRKLNAWFSKNFEKYDKIIHFCYFLHTSFLKMSPPPEMKSRRRRCYHRLKYSQLLLTSLLFNTKVQHFQ